MKNVNVIVLSKPDTASQTSAAIDGSQMVSASFLAYFGDGDAAGTLKIQASNDLCPIGYIPSDFTPVNWADVPSQSASVASGASVLLTITQCTYRWLRVVYTRSGGGSTTINVAMFAVSI